MSANTLESVRKGGLFTVKPTGKQIYIKVENDRLGRILCRKALYKNERFLWYGTKIVYPLTNKDL